MKNTSKLLITSLLAVGGMLMPAVAAPITLDVVADNFTSALNQTTNYGTNTKINILADGSYDTKERIGYFRFDLSAYTGGTISGASFTLVPYDQFTANTNPQDFTIYGISDGGASENFAEGSQTWSNSGYAYSSGDITGTANFGDLVDLGTLSGVSADDIGNPVNFSSAALDNFLNNDGNNIITFLVYNTNGVGNFNGFEAKDLGAGRGSSLTVVPEPSSVVMVGLGLLAAFGLARKRCA